MSCLHPTDSRACCLHWGRGWSSPLYRCLWGENRTNVSIILEKNTVFTFFVQRFYFFYIYHDNHPLFLTYNFLQTSDLPKMAYFVIKIWQNRKNFNEFADITSKAYKNRYKNWLFSFSVSFFLIKALLLQSTIIITQLY